MALVRTVQEVLLVIVVAVFVISLLIMLSMGVPIFMGALWSFFNMIGADFPVESALEILPQPVLLAFYIIGVIGRFAFTVILTTIFYQLLGSINISERIVEFRARNLANHIIISPANDLSTQIAQKLRDNGIPYIIIDRKRSAAAKLNRKGVLALHDEALDDFAMKRAHVEKAHALLLLDEDMINNTLVALAAKKANSRLRIIARTKDIEEIPKMSRVGVNRIIIPESAAGIEIGEYISMAMSKGKNQS